MRHATDVSSAEFSSDGLRVVTAAGTEAQVWLAETGNKLGPPLRHGSSLRYASFSSDGVFVLTYGKSDVQIWERASGQPIGERMQHPDLDLALFSPDGSHVLTSSSFESRLWQVQLKCCSSKQQADMLADLSETISGYRVSDTGSLAWIGVEGRRAGFERLSSFR